MQTFKDRCIDLRRQDMTIGEIARLTGRAKSSIYTYIKDIPLSPERRKQITKRHTVHLVTFNKARKGISALGRHPKEFHRWTPSLISLVAHLLFDGEMSGRGSCVYTNSSAVLLQQVRISMKKIYDFEPKRVESTPGVYRISYHNVELESYLKKKAVELMRVVPRLERNLQRQFLRAFFDDEGSVYFIGTKRAVRGYQHNHKTLFLVQRLLKGFGIESAVDVKYNEITITKKENLKKFSVKIGFSPGVRINGNRANSRWKQHLEKRDILRRAIAAYQK